MQGYDCPIQQTNWGWEGNFASMLDDYKWTSEGDLLTSVVVKEGVFLVVEDDVVDGLEVMSSDVVLLVRCDLDREMVNFVVVFHRQCIMSLKKCYGH